MSNENQYIYLGCNHGVMLPSPLLGKTVCMVISVEYISLDICKFDYYSFLKNKAAGRQSQMNPITCQLQSTAIAPSKRNLLYVGNATHTLVN